MFCKLFSNLKTFIIKDLLFTEKIFDEYHQCQIDKNQAGHFVFFSGLIWVQSACKVYYQVTKGKSLNPKFTYKSGHRAIIFFFKS